MFQQADFGFRQKLNQQVNVAVRSHLAPGGGAKHGQFPDLVPSAKLGQLIFLHGDKSETNHSTIMPQGCLAGGR